ncbi:MATE family efflux transporter [Treponema sp.]|uniref:MATE family efflux transporter n=1 Tax=Treponema sp. TaxID=166 RepID=UPI0025DF767E|nr:MATE family efflux transporter [Treponema sp.]MCR5218300.1 MATE family efflux transporter [Treponema sp.]
MLKDKQDFTQGHIFSKLVNFMLPILLSLVLQSLYSAVDMLIVGHFGSDAGISGVNVGGNVMNLFTMLLNSITMGVTVLMGQYIGAKRYEDVNKLIGNAVAFFLALSLILTAGIVIFARPLAIAMQTPEEAVDLTVQYIRICGAGFIFITFYNFISAMLRGTGDSVTPLIFVAIASLVNIAGDLILVAGFKMNVAGAAIATVAAQAVSVILSMEIIRRRKMAFSFKRKYFNFGSEVPRFVKLGMPLTVQGFLTNFSFLALCAFVNKLGLDASSGYGVAQKIQLFIMLIPSALMQSMAPFVSQNVGAGNEKRARSGMLCGQFLGAGVGLFITIATFFFGDYLAMLFTSNTAYIARAFEFLRGFAPEAIVTCILFSYLGYFNGHSKSLFVMIQGLLQTFLVRLPVSYVMSIRPDASLTGVGAAAPLATVFGIAMCFVYYKWMGRSLDKK